MNAHTVYFVQPGKAEVREEQVPDPAPNQVQVRCVANGICMAEVSLFTGAEPTKFPRAVGHEGIAVVTKVGKGVTHIAEGDYVACGKWSSVMNLDAAGAIKYNKRPADPALYLTEPVACIVTALYEYDITPGDRVLLMGAGFMGLLNVQGVGRYPLSEFVVADIKSHNLQLARAYGATEIVRSGTTEGNARLEELKSKPFDLVIEAAGVAETIQSAGSFTRSGGRLAVFAWHHAPRSLNLGLWHSRGLKVLNTAPGIGADRKISSMERAARLLERGVFDLGKLVTHRHPVSRVQEAMELSAKRPDGFIKGVLTFEQ